MKITKRRVWRSTVGVGGAFVTLAVLVGMLYGMSPKADAAGETIGGSSSHTFRVNQQAAISDIVINGTGNDTIPVKLTVGQGTLYMTTTSGLTFVGPTSGSTISFSGTRSDVNAALATLHYAGNSVGSQTLTISLADSNTIFNPANNHVYQYVPGDITWDDAKDAAAAMTYGGLTGYLATITSQDENDFIKDRLNGDAWLGGSDKDVEGHWNWVTGPEAGTNIYNGEGWGGANNGVPVSGQYNNWADGEPNQAGEEDCMETYISNGTWNDYPCTTTVSGYVVEYGEPGHTASAIPEKDITITTTAVTFAGGNGTSGNPYQITDCERFQGLNQNLSAHYVLAGNLDCTETTGWNGGKGFDPIGDDSYPFTGTIDGNGHTIDGVYINRADDDPDTDSGSDPFNNEEFVGLVGYMDGGTIQDLHVTNSKVKGYAYVGGLVGYMNGGTISGSSFNVGTATNSCNPGNCVWARYGYSGGGLVGEADNATITHSHTGGPVKGSGQVIGGLVGNAVFTTISDSSSTSPTDGGNYIGGAIGMMECGALIRTYATGTVDVNQVEGYKQGTYGGGLVGAMDCGGLIQESYATGDVSVEVRGGGGLVGVLFSAPNEITDSYATGDVSGSGFGMGGLIGEFYQGTVTRTYASGTVDGSDDVGGLIGMYYNGGVVTDSFASGEVGPSGHSAGFAGKIANLFTPPYSEDYFDVNGTNQTYCSIDYDDNQTNESGCHGMNAGGSQPQYFINYANAPFTQSGSRVWSESTWYFDGLHHPVLRLGTNSTASVQPQNDDGDGISASVENAGPNGGDGNNDGTPDSQQPNVTSFVNSVTGQYVTLEVDGACSITNATTLAEPSGGMADGAYNYPFGLLSYTTDCGTPGYSTEVTVYYHGTNTASGMVARKYNSMTHSYGAVSGAVISGTSPVKVIYTVTDGLSLDEDGVANGIIVDPIGLAVVSPSGILAATGVSQFVPILLGGAFIFVAGSMMVGARIRSTR